MPKRSRIKRTDAQELVSDNPAWDKLSAELERLAPLFVELLGETHRRGVGFAAIGDRINEVIYAADMSAGSRRVPYFLSMLVYERDGYQCVTCGAIENLGCDHVTPWSQGGETKLSNLQTMCEKCNSDKGNATPFDVCYICRADLPAGKRQRRTEAFEEIGRRAICRACGKRLDRELAEAT